MTTVYVLGAGFSKAISAAMPTLAELSDALAGDLEEVPGAGTPLANDFERWMSYLIEGAPWLTAAERLRNEAAFNDIALAVHRALSERQQLTSQREEPVWLETLVGHWERTDATVLTFNYDTLIELSYMWSPYRRSIGGVGSLYPAPVINALARAAMANGWAEDQGGTKLLKLHGSLNWYYSGPGGPRSDPIYLRDIAGFWGSSPDGGAPGGMEDGLAGSAKLLADKVPMIVPPAAVKSPYYGSDILRSLWRQGGDALQRLGHGDELVIMGLGLPATDLVVGSLLATCVSEDVTIVPVDPSRPVVDRLRSLFRYTDIDGPRTQPIDVPVHRSR